MISKKDVERSTASGGNYQNNVIAYASEDDMEALNEDDDDDEGIIEAVSKVSCCHMQQIAWLTILLLALQNCVHCSLKSTKTAGLA